MNETWWTLCGGSVVVAWLKRISKWRFADSLISTGQSNRLLLFSSVLWPFFFVFSSQTIVHAWACKVCMCVRWQTWCVLPKQIAEKYIPRKSTRAHFILNNLLASAVLAQTKKKFTFSFARTKIVFPKCHCGRIAKCIIYISLRSPLVTCNMYIHNSADIALDQKYT